jgi:LysR family glycine cleavage system transcriptional activator
VVDLHTSEFDAAIRFGDGQYPGLTSTRLMGDVVLPACSPTLLTRLGRPKDIADLARMPLLHDTPTETDHSGSGWPHWLAYVGREQLHFGFGMRFDLANLVIEAAVRGLGVALVRWSLAESELANGRLVPAWLHAAPTTYSYYFVSRPGALTNVRVRTFRDWLAAECGGAERAMGAGAVSLTVS